MERTGQLMLGNWRKVFGSNIGSRYFSSNYITHVTRGRNGGWIRITIRIAACTWKGSRLTHHHPICRHLLLEFTFASSNAKRRNCVENEEVGGRLQSSHQLSWMESVGRVSFWMRVAGGSPAVMNQRPACHPLRGDERWHRGIMSSEQSTGT